MTVMSRRSVVRTSLGAAAAGTLARPYIANAAATTAIVWWAQGFVEEEDVAFKKIVADYEKASGNKIDYSIIPFAPQRQKIVSAMTSGVVPDLFPNNPVEIVALYAWDDKLVDVSDVVATQNEEFTETALINMYCYNSVTKKRSFYGVPYTIAVYRTMSGGRWSRKPATRWKTSRRPGTPIYDFFKDVQKKLREQRMRNVYGLGFNVTTNGNDPNNVFNYFLIAYGGQDIVTKDGKLHLDDPQVKEAAIKALTYPTTAYKEGFVPPGAINWNDADDNNAFHAKQIVMDLDGTISTEVAVFRKQEGGLRRHRHDGPAAQQRRQAGAEPGRSRLRPDPEGGEKRRGRQGFPEIFHPAEGQQRVSEGRARPQYPVHALDRQGRPVVVRRPAPEGLCEQGLLGPTLPQLWVFNPAYAQVQNEHVWPIGWMDIIGRDGAAGGGREGVQAGRGDLREIPD